MLNDSGFFHDFVMPWLGKDTYLLYAPVCRRWAAAFDKPVTHPRYAVADLETFLGYEDTLLEVDEPVFVARYATDPRLLSLFPVSYELAIEAAGAGNVAGVKRFIDPVILNFNGLGLIMFGEEGRLFSEVCLAAAKGGHLHVLAALDFVTKTFPLDALILGRAGNIEMLKYRMMHPCELSVDLVAIGAVEMGHIHVLQWLSARGFVWQNAVMITAAAQDPPTLEYLISEGCEADHLSLMDMAVTKNNIFMMQYLYERHHVSLSIWTIIEAVRESTRFAAAQWLIQNGYPLAPGVLDIAVRTGHVGIMRLLIDAGVPMTGQTVLGTIKDDGTFNCTMAKLLMAEGCPLDERFLLQAIRSGAISAIKWGRAQGLPWPADAMAEAAALPGAQAMVEFLVSEGV